MTKWLQRLTLLLPWTRRRREQTLEEELASHLQMAEEAAHRAGLSPEQARHAAHRDLGNMTLARESVRSEWVPPRLEHFVQDIIYVSRALRREPLFACVAIGSLALGIGAANTVFSLVDGILLRPLAYTRPGQLAYLQEFVPALAHVYPSLPVNYRHFRYWETHTRTLQGMVALRASAGTLTGAGEPIPLDSVETTAGLFQVLGTKLALGRGFLSEEDKPGHSRVAVISDHLWRTRFHSDPGIIGRRIIYEGAPVNVVGVLPPDFTFPAANDLGRLAGLGRRIQIFLPIQSFNEGWDGDYDYIVFARLRDGTSLSQGLAELTVLTRQFAAAYHVESKPHPVGTPLQEAIGSSVRGSLWALFTSVLVLLLIVCVNMANLTLARAHVRAREFSIRAALGAGRKRLVQQILTEILFISLLGGSFGIAMAAVSIQLLKTHILIDLPRLSEVRIDTRVLLFSLGLTIVCACISGLTPAYRAARSDLQEAMGSGGPAVSAGRRSLRLRHILVGCEVCLSTMLVFLAGLLIFSLMNLLQVDKGFEEKGATAIDLSLPDTRYPNAASRARFFDRALAQIRAVPGIRSAAIVNGLPLTGESHVNGIELQGDNADWIDASSKTPVLVNVRFTSPDYFQTLGIPLLQGRSLKPQDRDKKVAVLSERLAAKLWRGQDPLGKRFKTGSQVGEVQVVGVVRDTYNGRLDEKPTLIVYVPFWIRPPGGASLIFRTAIDPRLLIRPVQRVIWSIDSSLPISEVRTLSEIVSAATAQRRFQMQLATGFGLAALFLAVIGIYGVVSYSVEQGRSELSLRLALGAEHKQLFQLTVKHGLVPVLVGLGSGLVLSVATGGLVRGLVFGVTPSNPLLMSGVSVLVILAAVVACLVPACRVLNVEPASILRHQ